MSQVQTKPAPSRRGERTRQALLTAAQGLLAERSIDALSVDDIVQTAGVAKGSFYNHFEDKQELASVIQSEIRSDIENAIAEANDGVADPAVRAARAMAVYIDYIIACPQRASVMVRVNIGLASMSNPMNKGVVHDVAAGLQSGRFVTPSVEAGALFIIGACHMALMHAVENPNPPWIKMIAQQLGALMLRGLGVPMAESEALLAAALHDLVKSDGPPAA